MNHWALPDGISTTTRIAINMLISLPVHNNNATKIFNWAIPSSGIMLRDLHKHFLTKICKSNKE